jgi:hypothetical protein
MAEHNTTPAPQATSGKAPERDARRAAALRANLARRKAQARARADEAAQNRPPEPERD